jgi:lysyl-tRNA synthetase class 2
MNQPRENPSGGSSGDKLEASRRDKLRRIIELGHDPWGRRFDDHQPIGQIRALESEIVVIAAAEEVEPQPAAPDAAAPKNDDDATAPPARPPRRKGPEEQGPRVRAAGRIVLQRKTGKLVFLNLVDWTGGIQIMIGKRQVGEDNWNLVQCFDLGDLVGVEGELKHTNTGELTIFAEKLFFFSKALDTPPEKHKGLTDPELRQRMRYLDLIHTEGVRERFLDRARIVRSIRDTLSGEGFVEAEGPTLHSIAGGAAARPFATHHNALDIPLFLRIALELHLKRLLVGGIERVYELGRVYRNEGISQKHNPEFTMLEAYQAYGDYCSMMDLTEKIIADALVSIGGGPEVTWGEATIDFSTPFARRTYNELFTEHTGIEPGDEAAVLQLADTLEILTAGRHADVIRNEIFEAKVEDQLAGPIFVTDYPASICPLTKRKAGHPEIAERFELFVQGMEIANAYTELNDPDLQEELFLTQLAGQRDEDSMAKMDQDFLRALRQGMPPAGGLGIGIDRLVMLLTNSTSIREVILFPLLRPEGGS